MTTVRLLAVLVLAALAAPVVGAAPADGRLDVQGTLALPQGARVVAPGGELWWASTGIPALTIEAEEVSVERWGTRTVRTALPNSPFLTTNDVQERASHGASTITLEATDGPQHVALRAAELDVQLAPTEVAPVATASLAIPSKAREHFCKPDMNCLVASATYMFEGAAQEGVLRGDVLLILRGPAAVVSEGSATATYASGSTETSDGATVTQDDVWVVLRLAQATVTLAADGPAPTLFAARPEIQTSTAEAAAATGSLSIGSRTYLAANEALEAAGLLTLAPLPVALAPQGTLSNDAIVPAPGFSTTVEGDIRTINLDAVPVYADKPAEAAGAIVGVAALAAGLAYFWPLVQFHATAAALPLYTRLSKPDILANDVRNHIFEIIRQNPGISARAVHRMSDQSWGTVVYHLRQLERHHVVVSRALGRTRNYYENHGKYRGMEVQLACLQSDRARALARLVADAPGITQELLVERSGFPQPTTSYYVRKLKRASLIDEAREGRYVRYVPKPELPRFLELAETQPADAPQDDEAVPPAPPAAQA